MTAPQFIQGGLMKEAMSTVVLFPGVKRLRPQRSEDAETITHRRVIAGMEAIDDRAAWAIAAVARRKLPCENLRCIVSTLDQRKDFDLRLCELEEMKARHHAEEARLRVLEAKNPGADFEADWEASRQSWCAYRDRVAEFAEIPAQTKAQALAKRNLIGSGWLRADGEAFDRMRAGVAADDARFPKRSRTQASA